MQYYDGQLVSMLEVNIAQKLVKDGQMKAPKRQSSTFGLRRMADHRKRMVFTARSL